MIPRIAIACVVAALRGPEWLSQERRTELANLLDPPKPHSMPGWPTPEQIAADAEQCGAWIYGTGNQWRRCPRPAARRRSHRPVCRRHARARVVILRPPELARRLTGNRTRSAP